MPKMDFTQNNSTPAENPDSYLTPATLSLSLVLITVFGAVYTSCTSQIDKRAPDFVADTIPFFGAFNFYAKSREWWQTAIKNSKTGAFSFWVGKHHVVGISGESARKMFIDTHDDKFDIARSQNLHPLGSLFLSPMSRIYQPGFHNGRSYFMRRLMDLHKTERLDKYLVRMTGDCRRVFASLPAENPAGFVNPRDATWRTVFSQLCRLIYTDEVADDPQQLDVYRGIVETLLTKFSIFNIPWPWLPTPSLLTRRRARRELANLVQGRIDGRLAEGGAPRRDDGLQYLIDSGDRKDYIRDFYVGGLFIVSANARLLTGQMLHVMATRPDWQARVYAEIEAAAAAHSRNKDPDATLVDKLDALPVAAWEKSFPSLQICYSEVIRMWAGFPMGRQNISEAPIDIPGTNQVIPPGSFVTLHTTEVNFNPDLYKDPDKFDPERWLDGRDHSRDQAYGFLGWGGGAHPCPGVRWAKLQQNIILAYALAMYEWKSCDANGLVDARIQHMNDLESVELTAMPNVHARFVPRNKA